jgi:2-methylcitrate dehydratase PrpD
VGIDSFTDERCARADVAAMLPKVRLVQSPESPASLDRMWVDVTVDLASGERVAGRCAKPKGAWGEPISEKDHLVKVRDCLRIAFDPVVAEEIIATVRRFETLDSPAVRAFVRMLANFTAH